MMPHCFFVCEDHDTPLLFGQDASGLQNIPKKTSGS